MLAKVAMFGNDDRIALPENLAMLSSSVGLVASESERTLCTGFCVGKRTIATAAHCLFRTVGERRADLGSFRFIVGEGGNRRRSAIRGRDVGAHRQHVVAGSFALNILPPIDATRDWALMRLEQPICGKNELLVDAVSPPNIQRIAERGRLLHVSFHSDVRNWRLKVSPSCRVKAELDPLARAQVDRDFVDTAALVLHECDTGLASSGSPLLTIRPDNSLRVTAINVGTYQQTRYLVTGRSVKRRYKPATVANTAVSGSAFADHVLAFTRADIIGDQEGIRRLQSALRAKGFDPGPSDGIFGERSRSALIHFERSSGAADIGLATYAALRAVEGWQREPGQR